MRRATWKNWLIVAALGGCGAALVEAQTIERRPRSSPSRDNETPTDARSRQIDDGRTIQRSRGGGTISRGGTGGTSIRHAERNINVDRSRNVVRIDRDRSPRVRSVTRVGSRFDRLPDRVTVIERDRRRIYRHGDDFFFRIGRGPRVQYVAARPPIGVYVNYLPERYRVIHVGPREYYFYDNVYYEPVIVEGRPSYVVVPPPIGATVYELPANYISLRIGGFQFFASEGVYYRPQYQADGVAYVRVEPPQATTRVVQARLELPDADGFSPGAVVDVRLIDQRRPSEPIAQYYDTVYDDSFSDVYEIPYDPSNLDPRGEYALEARVIEDGRVVYANENVRPIQIGEDRSYDLRLRPTR